MLKRAIGWVVLGLGGFSLACGSGEGSSQTESEASAEPTRVEPASVPEANVPEASVPDAVRYQFVGTAEGMTVEAVSKAEVQTFSCPTPTCAGLCDECAARACEASGELAGACAALVRNCTDTCTCNQGPGSGIGSCGFPVCAQNRNLCYYDGADEVLPGGVPGGPGPRPDPDPRIRPSSDPSSSTPSSAGANAAQPAG
jgi:hypothetical protein